jgi:hypothetical protein
VSCGLVTDRLVGVGSGHVISSNEDEDVCVNERRKYLISQFLYQFHIDGEILEMVTRKYARIYDRRSDVTKTDHRHRLAIAFSICDVLNTNGCPRPESHVSHVCGVKEAQMLNLAVHLGIPHEKYSKDYVITYAEPYLYVDTFCDYLGVPYKITCFVRDLVLQIGWSHYGKKPETIVGGVLMKVLRATGYLDKDNGVPERLISHVFDFDHQSMRRFEKSLKSISPSFPECMFKIVWKEEKVEWINFK